MKFFDVLRRNSGAADVPPWLSGTSARYLMESGGYARVLQSNVVDITNVTKYFFEESPKDIWELSEFPKPVPPFEYTWLEAPVPDFATVGKRRIDYDYSRAGMEKWALFIWRTDDEAALKEAGLFEGRTVVSPWALGARWILHITMLVRQRDRTLGPVGNWELILDKNGVPITKLPDGGDLGGLVSRSPLNATVDERRMMLEINKEMHKFIQCGLFALSLMNCQNATLEEVAPPPKLVRKHERKHGTGLVKYRVVKVTPRARRVRRGTLTKSGVERAVPSLHLKRGHFKHFGPEYGKRKLFGKWSGMWWWDTMTAGSAESGLVEHDYEVDA